ncbi:MAG: bifunctional oligoribonuclease/PAP phosphatase NrnA [candidate division Zixibacteria bacterium]|nr:bifunctional oligoribonuclease/PAP phosphatase NrnA [candidate division Zixibacteria bacterium]
MKKTLEKIQKISLLINDSKNILITGHENPDGDSLGSQLALAEYLSSLSKSFRIINKGDIPYKFKFIDGGGYIQSKESENSFKPDLAIVIECPNLGRIGWVRKYITDDVKIINIDHHQNNKAFGDINLIDTTRAAVGEIIFDVFKAIGYHPGKSAANSLYLAIYTDTGRFRHDSTTPEALRASADLIAYGADPKLIADNAYCNYPVPALRLLGEVLRKIELFLDERVCFLTLLKEDVKSTGANVSDLEGLIDYSMYNENILVGLLFKQLDTDEIRVSFRCREKYDILPIAVQFGGGGHHHAAGCSIPGDLENARKQILKALRRMLDGS